MLCSCREEVTPRRGVTVSWVSVSDADPCHVGNRCCCWCQSALGVPLLCGFPFTVNWIRASHGNRGRRHSQPLLSASTRLALQYRPEVVAKGIQVRYMEMRPCREVPFMNIVVSRVARSPTSVGGPQAQVASNVLSLTWRPVIRLCRSRDVSSDVSLLPARACG